MFGIGLRSFVVALLSFACLFGPSLPGLMAANAQANDTLPDLPAMLLRTEQIAEAGFEDQVFPTVGNCLTLEQKAQYVAASRGMDEADVLEQLDDAGWQGNCGQTYSLLAEGKESVLMTPSDLSISSYVYMYEDAEGAEAGFEFLEDESGNAFAEDIPEGTDIGDVLGDTDERA